MSDEFCQTCGHEKAAHLDHVGACCMGLGGQPEADEWCSCVQFVPPTVDDWIAGYAQAAARNFTALPTFEKMIARIAEHCMRDLLAKAVAIVEEHEKQSNGPIARDIRKLGTP